MISFNAHYAFSVQERFLSYVQIDTQSDPNATVFPSTPKQKDLLRLLANELKELGIADAHMDEFGYVYATIPATVDFEVPVICFCSHVDTAPDCSGTGVQPLVHNNYDGVPIVLPNDHQHIISVEHFPYLKQKIGDTIITASGDTLLGADDKSGVAIIMDFVQYLVHHSEVPHGVIKVLFTPDEEVGRGTAFVDIKKLGAYCAYTLDGGAAGDFEDETFSADGVVITINGVIAHPGEGKGKLVNAIKIVGEILAALPKDRLSPETTDGREGFIHPTQIQGGAENATIEFLIRSFSTDELAIFELELQTIAANVLLKYPSASMDFTVKEQYRNMKEILDNFPAISAKAKQAIELAGLQVRQTPIRGGTDGSKLSFKGLPCPNIFTGMQGIHSKKEWISVQDMQKSVEVLVYLSQLWTK